MIPELNINSSFDGNYRSGQIGAAGYTGDMLNLLGGIAGNSAPGPISLEINGLTPGQDYLFQGYWEANDFGQTVSVTFEGTDTQGGITGVGGLATLISYSFTATDSTLNADLSKTAGADNNWWLGYSLQTAQSLAVTNGSFEFPDIGGTAQVQDIPNWVRHQRQLHGVVPGRRPDHQRPADLRELAARRVRPCRLDLPVAWRQGSRRRFARVVVHAGHVHRRQRERGL